MKKIGTINETKHTMHEHHIKAKKHFGQNFLVDQNILNEIADQSLITKDTIVIEVGPGLGSLTQKLLEKAGHVLAYEIDRDFIPILKKTFKGFDNFTFVNQDILTVDIDQDIFKHFGDRYDIVVVSNLPYYITTPILMKFLETSKRVKKLVFMVQYEVGMRITSKPNSKDYNALSIAIQYRASARILFKVPRTVFIPAPNVDSAVVEIITLEEKKYLVSDELFFYRFIRECFTQRRKTLMNNLRSAYPEIPKTDFEDALLSLSIPLNIRAEALSLEEIINLTNAVLPIISD